MYDDLLKACQIDPNSSDVEKLAEELSDWLSRIIFSKNRKNFVDEPFREAPRASFPTAN